MSSNTTGDLIAQSVERLLRDVVTAGATVAAEVQGIDRNAWTRLARLGLVGPDAGELGLRDTVAIVRSIGHAGALVPYADSEGLARWLALQAGIQTSASEILGFMVFDDATLTRGDIGADTLLSTPALRLPWGRITDRVVVGFALNGKPHAGIVHTADLGLVAASNLAGEPADRYRGGELKVGQVREIADPCGPLALRRRAGLLRSAAMLGAIARIHELAIVYAGDRKQFGKSLSQFQVIQSYLAEMAGELDSAATLLECCLPDAPDAGSEPPSDGAEIAALRVRVGAAAQRVAALAHQIHGAIGFTQEYPLHLWSRRLWAWREEYGNDAWWRAELGRLMIGLGADHWRSRITD